MKRKEFLSVDEMQAWLKKAAGCLIIAVGLVSSSSQLATTLTSPLDVGSAIEQCDIKIGGLPCFVDYESTYDEDVGGDIDYSQFIVAQFADRSLDGRRWSGNEDRLLEAVNEERLVVRIDQEPLHRIGRLMVKAPSDPRQVREIAARMAGNGSVLVTIPGGSDRLILGVNAFEGEYNFLPT
ncbi:hypothetical protein [Halomonas sp. CKK8]|uniref:hypothetical protein n=1 Tax=Halomonas sp. CKK8 TaxID=3036127 RepID=UPI0024157034|nr:hypothetical protein [Halomonas sp. CKK8]WFM72976.1 hypothetical protein P8934_08260 [Halomonas sp. CKK8]